MTSDDKVKMFCLPYAGASAVIYNSWKRYLKDFIELVPVELSGRGSRSTEPFYETIEEAVTDIYGRIRNTIQGRDYALFGHSMGALLAYEICHKIREDKLRMPVHIFLSAKEPPHIKADDRILYHKIPHEKFVDEIMKFGGTPEEFFERTELKEYFIPILKADFKLFEMYTYPEYEIKLLTDVTILYGENDDIEYRGIQEWDKHFEGDISYHLFKGGHFYYKNNLQQLMDIINQKLCNYKK
jgi:medium-chain acyl-[acyl-carrier-protein] hydrolase